MITLKGITKIYNTGGNKFTALDNVNLEILTGEFVSIMGPSGSGKSTLMSILGLLEPPTSGEYILDKTDTSKLNDNKLAVERSKHIGFIFQSFNLIKRLSALDNVILPVYYTDCVISEKKRQAIEYLNRVGLGDKINSKIVNLSGGQQQRVAIARALINNPSFILADEPTGNLDSKSSIEIMKILMEFNSDGKTLIVVTHDPNISKYAKRVIHIFDGKIQEK